MTYQKQIDVICLGNPKQSAIYFDSIIPISYFVEAFGRKTLTVVEKYGLANRDISELPQEVLYEFIEEARAMESLLGIDFDINVSKKEIAFYFEYFMSLWITCYAVAKIYFNNRGEKEKAYAKLAELIGDSIPESIVQMLDSISEEMETSGPLSEAISRGILDLLCLFYIENIGLLRRKGQAKDSTFREDIDLMPAVQKGHRRVVLPSSCFNYLKAAESDTTIYLSNLQLIDTSNTEWSKIVEFRKDEDARRKLRNLRLFFHTTYGGKSLVFFEDDLNRRLEEYYATCKEWGFETTTSAIMAVMDSTRIQATLGTAIASAILDGPLLVTVAALTGSLLEIGKIALGFARAKHSFQKLKRDHDLAFIIEAKEKLEKPRHKEGRATLTF